MGENTLETNAFLAVKILKHEGPTRTDLLAVGGLSESPQRFSTQMAVFWDCFF